MRRSVIRLTLAAALVSAGPVSAQDDLIRMGVRVDARPFAWRDEGSGAFLGFLVDLCVDAVARAGYPFEQVPVTASERLDVLSGARRDIDLLCDPTTITLQRLSDLAALEPPGSLSFSPIVFVANGSYLENGDAASGLIGSAGRVDCVAAAPAQPDDAPEEGEDAAADEAAAATYLGAGYVVGTTIGEILGSAIRDGRLELAAGQHVCPVEYPNHSSAAEAFCRGEVRYYFGDADIIEANVLDFAAPETACGAGPLPSPISYEPYALVISGRLPQFRDDFVRALYGVFHHGTAIDRFHGHFEGRQMSPFLETLFRINQIPAGNPTAAEPEVADESGDTAPQTAARQGDGDPPAAD